MEDRMLMKV